MRTNRFTTVSVVAVIVVATLAVAGYLLYAIPESDANTLSHKLSALRSQHGTIASQLAAANRRAAAAERRADSADAQASKAFARGHAKGLADAAASIRARYDAGYEAGNAAAFGSYGNNWSNGAFYVIRMVSGANGGHQITERALLQECLAVYGQGGSVYVQGPAC